MKLYTTDQVVDIFEKYGNMSVINARNIIDLSESIELPSDEEIWRWWQTQKFQKEQGEQEYTMLYEIDLPKILKAFIEHFSKIQGGNNE